MSEQLLIYQKIYDFVRWLYPFINRIPKSHRLVLGRQIEELALAILVLIISANKSRGDKRKELQSQVSEKLDCLRILIRLSKDLKFMSIKQYTFASEKMNEIARMLIGWMKT